MTETQPSPNPPQAVLPPYSPRQRAWLLGTFNPIHNGHVAMAQMALGQPLPEGGVIEDVILVPAYASPWKHAREDMAPFEHRVAMVEAAIEGISGLSVSTIEATLATRNDRTIPTYTWATLQALHQQGELTWPANIVMGADALAGLGQWFAAEELIRHCRFWLAPRDGTPIVDSVTIDDKSHALDVHRVPMPPMPVASSVIRQAQQMHHPQWLVDLPKPVVAYIQAHPALWP